MVIGDVIQEFRRDRGLSQLELGKLIGLSGSAISAYEKGQNVPPPEILAKLADVFHVSVDYLLGRTRVMLDWDKITTGIQTDDGIFSIMDLYAAFESMTVEDRSVFVSMTKALLRSSKLSYQSREK